MFVEPGTLTLDPPLLSAAFQWRDRKSHRAELRVQEILEQKIFRRL